MMLRHRDICILLLVPIVLMFVPVANAEELKASRVTVTGLHSIGEEEFLDMFGVRTGDLFDRNKIRWGIKRAFRKNIFDDIDVHVREGREPDIEIAVKEKDIIRNIIIEGERVLAAKVIKKEFLFREGGPMLYDVADQYLKALRLRLGDYGYPEADARLDIRKTKEPNRVDLVLWVDLKKPLVIRQIQFVMPESSSSSAVQSKDLLANALSISPEDIFDRVRLDGEILKLREYLKSQGYIHPRVGPYGFKDGLLTIETDPGRKVEVSVEGNQAIATKRIMKEIPFFENEDFSDEAVGEATDRIQSIYHAEGYPFVQAAPVITSAGETIRVSFFIYEGEQVHVGNVTFDKVSLPVMRLKEIMSLKEGGIYSPDMTERDKGFLKEFYSALGYIDTEVRDFDVKIDRKTSRADIHIVITEGQKTIIESVEIEGAKTEQEKDVRKLSGLKKGDPYNEVDISDARIRLLEYYENLGYSNIDILIERKISDHKASIVFRIVEGKKKLIGRTMIRGNEKTRYVVIKRELEMKEGQPYSFRSISDVRQRLYKLGLFSNVELEPVKGENAENDVLVKVTEGDAGSVEFGVGYAEYEQFRGFVEVSYRNLWGMNRLGLIRTELSSLERRYILQYTEPWFLGIRLPFNAFFLHEDMRVINLPDRQLRYSLSRYTFTAGVEKKLTDRIKAEIYYEFSLVRTSNVQPDVVLTKEDVGTIAISSIKPGLVYDTRDDIFEPTKGVLAGVSLKFATPLLLSQAHFAKVTVYGSTFHKLHRRIVLALSVRGGLAYDFGTTQELPLVERFFLGGRTSVRGFEQDMLGPKGADGNPTGGNAFLNGSVELRTYLFKGFGLVYFVDTGNVWTKVAEVSPSDLRYTTGLGLRYKTPVGPLRVDYGIKLDRKKGESLGEIHFSIGHAF